MAFDLTKVFSSLQGTKIVAPQSVVGIDFGSSSVKVVELQKQDDVVVLGTYGELQVGPYADAGMGASVRLGLQKKTEILVDIFRESGVTAKAGVFAVPLSESFITIMSLAAKPEEDIAPRVVVDARKYIPVPMSDVTLEWSEVTTPAQSEKGLGRDVLLVAMQNQSVADNRSLLDAISMTSRPAEIELFSTLRAVLTPNDTTLAVLDIGAGSVKLYIADAGVIQRIHRVPSGGSVATKEIASALGLSFEDAENLKRAYTPNHQHAEIIKKHIERSLERGLMECKRVLGQYEARIGSQVGRIVITGGVTGALMVPPFVGYMLDREVEVANPFKKIAFPAFLEDTLTHISPSFGVALGAALRHFE